ncbi:MULTISPECIES: hypothetical protein [unclassified Pseudovibrio]|uniref:hypothetical protein n=1 Tax=unclassified Pseudovibrio TaxID=2627060 RepID=UPI0007AE8092|nr:MULTISPECIES: hypothetical protein [unclassified Pseudovibrio]KZK90018.1 hypothetical protein PsAD5_04450 [Pseudovibrio sp. Ad5]KZK94285.1 hypothetical protein PsW74_04946 [Pseudovibrio sp. W74]KZL09900.1 hypothetical protein PsAD14_01423 [Pseudovibrio sp. Ad14]
MPLQNRVAPNGELCAVPARGMFMGNRGGRIHDPETQKLTGRTHASRRWLCCSTTYKDWHRDVWGKFYTELFFFDEVTALAAGHRPCFFCRKEDARRFAEHWKCCEGLEVPPSSDEMDLVLHSQRCGHKKSPASLPQINPHENWPEGAVVHCGDKFYALRNRKWWSWSFEGYTAADRELPEDVTLITPPQIIAILRDGYSPKWGIFNL